MYVRVTIIVQETSPPIIRASSTALLHYSMWPRVGEEVRGLESPYSGWGGERREMRGRNECDGGGAEAGWRGELVGGGGEQAGGGTGKK